MGRETPQKITNDFYRQFSHLLKKVAAGFGKEDLHELRVRFKKFRAFTRLLFSNTQDHRFKFSKKIKLLYHTGGCIRDYQLQRARIKKLSNISDRPHAYISFLKKSIHSFQNRFAGIEYKKAVSKNKKRLSESLPAAISPELFELFFKQQWNLIQAIVKQQSFTDEYLHNIRKYLKDIHYSQELYNELFTKKVSQVLPVKDIQQVKMLLDVLGDHQDLRRALDLLNARVLKRFGIDEQKKLAGIKLLLTDEKLALKKQVVDILKKAVVT